MIEHLIRKKFIEFLLTEKGFEHKQFIEDYQIPLGTKKYIAADLVIIEPNIREFLAFIEFKRGDTTEIFQTLDVKIKRNRKLNDLRYTPFYLVTGDDKSFSIYRFENNNWIELKKEDFPDYKKLSTNAINRIKLRGREEEINEQREELIRRKNKGIASLISITIASLAAVGTLLFLDGFSNSSFPLSDKKEEAYERIDS